MTTTMTRWCHAWMSCLDELMQAWSVARRWSKVLMKQVGSHSLVPNQLHRFLSHIKSHTTLIVILFCANECKLHPPTVRQRCLVRRGKRQPAGHRSTRLAQQDVYRLLGGVGYRTRQSARRSCLRLSLPSGSPRVRAFALARFPYRYAAAGLWARRASPQIGPTCNGGGKRGLAAAARGCGQLGRKPAREGGRELAGRECWSATGLHRR